MNREEIIRLIKEELSLSQERTRQIIREELSSLIGIDKYTFQKNLQIFDSRNIQVGRTNGCKIGTADDQKIGLYGNTPIVQGSAIADPTGGATIDDVARDRIDKILDRLQAIGIITT